MNTGTVEWVGSNVRNTKYGERKAWSLKIDGEFYNNAFKEPPCQKGDTVEFDFKTGQYGNDLKYISVVSAGAGTSAVTAGSSKGWPIPKDAARDRSIIRQSMIKAAVEFYCEEKRLGYKAADQMDYPSMDPIEVIQIAKQFEAYCTGDLDAAAAADFDAVAQEVG
jgi:hypothetical protein